MFKSFIKAFYYIAGVLILFVGNCPLSAQDKLLTILKDEIQREMAGFAHVRDSFEIPYFISYRVDDIKSETVRASQGSLLYSRASHSRIFTPMVRVGSYVLDNYHQLRETNMGNPTEPAYLPVEDSEDAIRQCIWWMTDQAHKNAVTRFEKVRSNMVVKVREEDNSADYTRQNAVHYFEPRLPDSHIKFNRKEWEEKLKTYSKVFKQSEDIIDGVANISAQVVRKYYVSSEGTAIAQNATYVQLSISGMVKATDGMELPLHHSWFALTANRMPSDKEVINEINRMVSKLKELKNAPVVEAFSGPALLSSSASGVFFHEIFGHRVEGQRMRQETDGQTFKKKVGQAVLPDFFTVYMDPTVSKFNGHEINGSYRYDDEGVKSQKVMLVENGILKNFLMSRVPVEEVPASNGHGRAVAGLNPVARQSNLIIETSQKKSEQYLREALRDELKRQSKEYGYYFAGVTGGFTQTGRYSPNAFNVTPNEVYRVYADGRPDELVRGVDLVGTPLTMFSQIEQAGGDYGYFIGLCGAESGSIQVSCISPMLFIKQIEIQKKAKSQSLLPLLPKP